MIISGYEATSVSRNSWQSSDRYRIFGFLIFALSALTVNDRWIPAASTDLQDLVRWFASLAVITFAGNRVMGKDGRWLIVLTPFIYVLSNSGVRASLSLIVFFCAVVSIGPDLNFDAPKRSLGSLGRSLNFQFFQMLPIAICFLLIWSSFLRITASMIAMICVLLVLRGVWTGRLRQLGAECRLQLNDLARPVGNLLFGISLTLVSWPFRWSAMPSVMFDDLSTHLLWYARLRDHGRLNYENESVLGYFSHQASNVLHGSLSLLSGAEARSGLVLAVGALVLLAANSIWSEMRISPRVRWVLLVAIASTPWFSYGMTTLQTELLALAVALAAVHQIIVIENPTWRSAGALTSTLLFLGALKMTMIPLTLALAIVALWRSRNLKRALPNIVNTARNWSFFGVISGAFLLVQPLVLSLLVHGDWLYFVSSLPSSVPYTDEVRWGLLYSFARLFWATGDFWEAADFTAGFHFLLIVPLGFMLLVVSSRKPLAFLFSLSLGSVLVNFLITQNYRYLVPGLLVSFVIASCSLRTGFGRRWILVPMLACIAANIFVGGSPSWVMASSVPGSFYREDDRDLFLARIAPQRVISDRIRLESPEERVLFSPSIPAGGTLQGTPLYLAWFDPGTLSRWSEVEEAKAVGRFLTEVEARAVVYSSTDYDDERGGHLLREYVAQFGVALDRQGNVTAYSVRDTPPNYETLFRYRRGESEGNSTTPLLESARLALQRPALGFGTNVEISKRHSSAPLPNVRCLRGRLRDSSGQLLRPCGAERLRWPLPPCAVR